MNEFHPRGGSMTKGILSATAGAVMYVVIPLIILASASSLMADAGGGEVAEQIGLGVIMENVLFVGVPIAAVSFFKGYYPKGSYSRATMGVALGALAGLWIWMATMGGRLDLQFEEIGLMIDVSGFVYLLLLTAALKAAYFVAEMFSYRKEWLQKRGVSPAPEGGGDGGAAAQ